MGSDSFVAGYLRDKGLKHLLLLRFIKDDVASEGFPREAEQMLKEAVVPRLSHISQISVEEQPLPRVDDGDGWSSPLSLAPVPYSFGGPRN